MKIILLFIVLIISRQVFSQDPHFSQYFASPLSVNPALTGNIDGSYRITSNYRQQWWRAGAPFNTGTVSYEHRLLADKLGESNKLGIGAMLMYDESLAGGLKSSYASISIGYHQKLDMEGYHTIGAGLQGSYGNRKIDFFKLNFASQFSSGGFNTSLPSGENFNTNLKPYFDMNCGLVYAYNDGNISGYAGASVYHIANPKQSILSDSTSRINRRMTLNGGINFFLGDSQNRILISGILMSQMKAFEFNLGTAYGIYLGGDEEKPKYLYIGGFYRLKDAIYPYLSYQVNGFQFGLSYDVATPGLKYSVPKNASFELSFIYAKPNDREKRRLMPWNY